MRGNQSLLQAGRIDGTSSRPIEWVFQCAFWTALVHLRVQILEVEDLLPMYQQNLSPSVQSDDGEHRARHLRGECMCEIIFGGEEREEKRLRIRRGEAKGYGRN